MEDISSRIGKRGGTFRVSSEPHDRYTTTRPYSDEELEPGIPILINTPAGSIVRKDVSYDKTICPECKSDVYYGHNYNLICDNCGMVVSDSGRKMSTDAKSTERLD